MLLALDIGNTNVTLGAFLGGDLKATWRISTDAHKMPDEYSILLRSLLTLKGIAPEQIRDVVLCSVVPPLTTVFQAAARDAFNATPLVVGTGTRTGVRIRYDNPRDVGADRIADSVAAYRLYGGPAVVVDFGTATVFDAINREGEYLGGAIAPGIGVSAEALYHGTAQLRRVELAPPSSAVGRNTVEALQSGLLFGHVEMVQGMVRRFQQELGGDAKAIATGGDASLIARFTSVFHAVNLDLTLIGLSLIHQANT